MEIAEEAVHAARRASEKWNAAPAHVKLMAGGYIEPVLYALRLMAQAVQQLSSGRGNSTGGE